MLRVKLHSTWRGILMLPCWLMLAIPALALEPARITATPDILSDYREFLAGRDVDDVNYYGGRGARRDVIELLLLQQALHLGGYHDPILIVPEENYRRTLHQVAAGELISSGALVWREDTTALREHLRISSPVIEDGDFVVGVYTAHDNHKALNTSKASLKHLSVVSSPNWKADIRTLEALGFKRLYLTNSWRSMVKMLAAHRADVTLAPFQPGSSMAIHQSEGHLVPIPGIKVALAGSRHWIVSRKHPQSEAYFQALQRGLRQLKQSGTLARAYRESGFNHPQVTHWQTLPAAEAVNVTAEPGMMPVQP